MVISRQLPPHSQPSYVPLTQSRTWLPIPQHTAAHTQTGAPHHSYLDGSRHSASYKEDSWHTAPLHAYVPATAPSQLTADAQHPQHSARASLPLDVVAPPLSSPPHGPPNNPQPLHHFPSLPFAEMVSTPIDPTTRPNTNPMFTVYTPCPPNLRPRSTLNPNHWEALLEGYPDPSFVANIVGISIHGARIGFEGSPYQLSSPNHSSALRIARELTENIMNELQEGRVKVIHCLPEAYVSSPLGAVQKKSNGAFTGWRRIHDLSFPHGLSVNDGIPAGYGSLYYETLDNAIALIASHGRYTTLHKRDCKDAFRKIPVSPFDLWLLMFEWLGVIYADLFLPFGLVTSPFLFNMFAEALHWILKFRYKQDVVHYLDDFLLIGGTNTSLFGQVCKFLGVEEKTSKSLDGFIVDFTGIELDTDQMEARLPRDKHERATLAVQSTLARGTISFKELRSLLGFLSFCSRVVPLGRPFLRNLFNHLEHLSHKHPSMPRRLPAPAITDLRWWATFLPQWHGKRLIRGCRPVFYIYMDAAGTKGIGGWWSSRAFSTRLPRRHRSKHINWKEAYAILFAIALWGRQWGGSRIVFMCDNSSISDAINKTSIRGEAISVLQLIFLGAAIYDFEIISCWLSSEDNWIADSLSRFTLDRLANAQLDKIFAINRRATGSPMSLFRQKLHDFFGSDSPLPLEPRTLQPSPTTSDSPSLTTTNRSPPRLMSSRIGSHQRSNIRNQTRVSSTSQRSRAYTSTEVSPPTFSRTNDSSAFSTEPSACSVHSPFENEPILHVTSSPQWSTSWTPSPTTTSTSRLHSQSPSQHSCVHPSLPGTSGTLTRPLSHSSLGDQSISRNTEPFSSFPDQRLTNSVRDTPFPSQQRPTRAAQSPPYERYIASTLNPRALPFSPVQLEHSTRHGCLTTFREPSSKRASTHSTSPVTHSAEGQPTQPSPQASPGIKSKTWADGSPMQLTSTSPKSLRSIYNSRPTGNFTWPPRAGKSAYLPIPQNFSIGDEFIPRLSGPFREDARQLSVAFTTAMGPQTSVPQTSTPI